MIRRLIPSIVLAILLPAATVFADEPVQPSKGAVLLGARVGGVLPFSKLSPNARFGLEAGYVFPWMKQSFAFALDVDYASLKRDGSQDGDPRVSGSAYNWNLTEQQLAVMPVFMYRMRLPGPITPYVGIGPRIYMLRSTVKGDAGSAIPETKEKSTKLGFGIPLGAEFRLGPGALTGELLFEYGSLDHQATGTSNTGGASLLLGYRFLL